MISGIRIPHPEPTARAFNNNYPFRLRVHSAEELPDMSSSMQSMPAAAAKSQRVLACVLCQSRKVKCDRNFPCSNCMRSGATVRPYVTNSMYNLDADQQCSPHSVYLLARSPDSDVGGFLSASCWTAFAVMKACYVATTSTSNPCTRVALRISLMKLPRVRNIAALPLR
jgi:hypothetical protein